MRPALGPLLVSAALALSGCERDTLKTLPSLVKSAAVASSAPAQGIAERLAFEQYRARQHLRPPLAAPEFSARACPDGVLRERGSDELGRTLVLRLVDQRLEPRFLVPLRITEQLESHELPRAAQDPRAGGAGLLPATPPSMPEREAERLLAELTRLSQRRYLGAYHVTDFRGPELVLKMGEIRRSWVAGIFRAWFVVYDLREQAGLCAFEVLVKNDTRDAPIRSRLRSETRTRLEEELGRSALAETRKGLGRITSVLRWPSAS